MYWRGRRFDTGEPVEVAVENGLILSVTAITDIPGLPWISPGWIDLQVNGYSGWDFNGTATSVEDVAGVTSALYARGVTAYLPTIITGSFERIQQALAAVAAACDSCDWISRSIPGIHLEGPCLSEIDGPRGAHERRHIRNPDWDEFSRWQETSGNRIKLVTIAPERPGAIPFIRKLTESGVRVSLGHTMASTEQIEDAVQAGATLSTHLGNGAGLLLPRHPNVIWDQLAQDQLWGMFIADGHHLPPHVLKVMLRAKRDRSILVSDCVTFGGMPPGRYESVIGQVVELHPHGKLTTAADPAILAGSAQALDQGLSVAVSKAGASLRETILACSEHPAKAMGFERLGRLDAGAAAHLTVFDVPCAGQLQVRETVVAGKRVYINSDCKVEENDGTKTIRR